MGCLSSSLGKCLTCLCCDCLWCECNCIIFPAPRFPFLQEYSSVQEGPVKTQFKQFITSQNKTVPFVQFSTANSRESKQCFIYFHGNAEDITIVGMFLEPVVQALDITFYAIEYPNYSSYNVCCPALISNTIKQDSIQFYDYLLRNGKNTRDINVMGRSIGTGGASYLAGHRNVPMLVLMSPFDSIKNVASGWVGCIGCLVKQHFDNLQEIVKFTGKLLVIHGEADEVIGVNHGKNLVKMYQKQNPYKEVAKKVYPHRMSHNSFDMDDDIIRPMRNFIKSVNGEQ